MAKRSFASSWMVAVLLASFCLISFEQKVLAHGGTESLGSVDDSLTEDSLTSDDLIHVGIDPALLQNPIYIFSIKLMAEVKSALENNGTTGLIRHLDELSRHFDGGTKKKPVEKFPFTHEDVRNFILQLNGGKPARIEVNFTQFAIEEAMNRLRGTKDEKGMGVDYLVLEQSPKAKLAELYYQFLDALSAETRTKLYFEIESLSANLYGKKDSIQLPVWDDAIERGNSVFTKEPLAGYGAVKTFVKDPSIQSKDDVPLLNSMKDPLPEHHLAFKVTEYLRLGFGVAQPLVMGPLMDAYFNHQVSAGEIASDSVAAGAEYNFVKPIPFTKGKIGGNAFWTRKMAEMGKKLPIILNLAYPAAMMLTGLAVGAMFHEHFNFTVGNCVTHPLLSLVTFGILSFGWAQPDYAKQLKQGYASRFTQFFSETTSLWLLQTARILGVVASFGHGTVLFHFLGADFTVAHLWAYGAQIAFAAVVSSGLTLREGIKLFGLKLLRGGKAYEDDRIRAQFNNVKGPAACQRMIGWIGNRYTLSYRNVVPGF